MHVTRASICKWKDLLLNLKTRLFSDFEEANGKSAKQTCAKINLNDLSDCAEDTFVDFVGRNCEFAAKKWAPFFFQKRAVSRRLDASCNV